MKSNQKIVNCRMCPVESREWKVGENENTKWKNSGDRYGYMALNKWKNSY